MTLALVDLAMSSQVGNNGEMATAAFNITGECYCLLVGVYC